MLGTTSGSHIGYRKVTEHHGQTSENGKIEYDFTSPFNYPDIINEEKPFGNPVSNAHKTGLLKEKRIFHKDGNLLQKTNTTYNFKEIDINSAKISYGEIPPTSDPSICMAQYYANEVSFYDKFSWWLQPLRMGFSKAQCIVNITYFDNGELTTTTDYIYNVNYQRIYSETVTRGVESQATSYLYAEDLSPSGWEADAIQKMIKRNMVSIPLEIKQSGLVKPG